MSKCLGYLLIYLKEIKNLFLNAALNLLLIKIAVYDEKSL